VEATKWYRLAAESDNAEAQNELGRSYQFGWGVDKDLPKALEWYRKAAAQGNETAKENLKRIEGAKDEK
jgi:hypothetical protein